MNEDLVANIDFMYPILELAGIPSPNDIQGRSVVELLRGHTPEDWRNAVYCHYWQHMLHRDVAAHYGLRTKDRKLIFYDGLPLVLTKYDPTPPEWEMFDLEVDPGEMNNVYAEPDYEDELDGLKKQHISLQEEFNNLGEDYPEMMEVQKKYFW